MNKNVLILLLLYRLSKAFNQVFHSIPIGMFIIFKYYLATYEIKNIKWYERISSPYGFQQAVQSYSSFCHPDGICGSICHFIVVHKTDYCPIDYLKNDNILVQ